jgi:tRNA modification GTPase
VPSSAPLVPSFDTIAAVATAAGRAAIGIVRVSGPRVPDIAAALLGAVPLPRIATLSRFLAPDGSSLDEGLALFFPAPSSFTGEHVLELQGHGGPLVLDLLMHRLLELGCRAAQPGEFSERAFLNGKIDIAQAEAVADLIDAGSAAAARAAIRSMRGEFSARIADLQQLLTELRKLVEASIDFPDEDIEFAARSKFEQRLAEIFRAFDGIQAAARQGSLLREGLNVVIAGQPNAGKSSLLNRLAGDEVAIVTDLPGTTRDVLRQCVQLDGLTLNLIDTAGLRSTMDVIEAEGVRRARDEIRKADVLLYIVDAAADLELEQEHHGGRDVSAVTPGAGSSRVPTQGEHWSADVPVAVVQNKIDLLNMPARIDSAATPVQIHLSAKTGAGIELLLTQLKLMAGYTGGEGGVLSARRRHLDALLRARQFVQQAALCLAGTPALELFAEDLRLAQRALGEITGEFASDDLLGEIFRSFCIGK